VPSKKVTFLMTNALSFLSIFMLATATAGQVTLMPFTNLPGVNLQTANSAVVNGNLVVTNQANGFGSSAGITIDAPIRPHDDVTVSFDVMFQPGADFKMGGKLFGLFGGTGDCTGGVMQPSCFSTRIMWRQDGKGEGYAYIPDNSNANYCNRPTITCNPPYGSMMNPGAFKLIPGTWATLTLRVKLNDLGQSNGLIAVRFNGDLVIIQQNLKIRNQPFLINKVLLHTFYGGGDKSWAPSTSQKVSFRNLRVIHNA
jgi:hypothetical protein